MSTCSKPSLRDLPLEQLMGKQCVIRGREYTIFDDLSADILVRNDDWTHLVHVWGYGPEQLWKQLKKLSSERVLAEIEAVKEKDGVSNKGGYLYRRLENILKGVSNPYEARTA